jgi:hypothetical protein
MVVVLVPPAVTASMSSVNDESVEEDLPPPLAAAVSSSSGGVLAASHFILLMWFLNIALVNQGMVGFMLSTMSVIVLYLTTPLLLALATSTFLATMFSAMSQVWRSRLAGLLLYVEDLPLLLVILLL